MRTRVASALAAIGFLMATSPSYAVVNCDFNQDTVELLKVKFQNLRDKYESDLNLIVGLGTNRNDLERRNQLFGDWGDVNGRTKRQAEIKDYADFIASFA